MLEDRDLEWEAEFRAAADPECAVPNCSETLRGFIPLSTRSMNDARQVCSRIAGGYDGYNIHCRRQTMIIDMDSQKPFEDRRRS